MPRITLIGGILPNTYVVKMDYVPQLEWNNSVIGATVRLRVAISGSDVVVVCESDKAVEFGAVYIRALDMAKTAVNLMAFRDGRAVNVHFYMALDDANNPTRLDLLAPQSALTAYDLSTEFQPLHEMIVRDADLFIALDDLIGAARDPHSSAINCARAIDAIRYLISPNEKNEKKAWAAMQNALLVEDAYLKFISSASRFHRHGNRQFIPGNVANELIERAWTVMNRYLAYRKAKCASLDPAIYPLLKGK